MDRKNILFLVADDMNYNSLGALAARWRTSVLIWTDLRQRGC